MPSEALLEPGEDRPGRLDGQLLAGYLEHERPERIQLRKLVHPGPRTEVRPRVDQAREDGIRLPEELPPLRIREGGHLAAAVLTVGRFAFRCRQSGFSVHDQGGTREP
jgi:hypothetical protein